MNKPNHDSITRSECLEAGTRHTERVVLLALSIWKQVYVKADEHRQQHPPSPTQQVLQRLSVSHRQDKVINSVNDYLPHPIVHPRISLPYSPASPSLSAPNPSPHLSHPSTQEIRKAQDPSSPFHAIMQIIKKNHLLTTPLPSCQENAIVAVFLF